MFLLSNLCSTKINLASNPHSEGLLNWVIENILLQRTRKNRALKISIFTNLSRDSSEPSPRCKPTMLFMYVTGTKIANYTDSAFG